MSSEIRLLALALAASVSTVACSERTVTLPVHLEQPSPSSEVSAGGSHSCAIKPGGGVWCWGSNSHGQLGDGTIAGSPTAVEVVGLPGAVSIATGFAHSCAVVPDGTVRCWGHNGNGQLGDGTNNDALDPVEVKGLRGVVAVSAGGDSTCALGENGGVHCWGERIVSYSGGPGEKSAVSGENGGPGNPTPVRVDGIEPSVSVSASDGYACALGADGKVRCWGHGEVGQLGRSPGQGGRPGIVAGIERVVSVAAGSDHACAAISSGDVYCWGQNSYGQLGTASHDGMEVCGGICADGASGGGCIKVYCSYKPAKVEGASGAESVSAGGAFSCALAGGGSVLCWGLNDAGQAGASSGYSISTASRVETPTPALSVSAGSRHACAVSVDGRISCWGEAMDGKLGNGDSDKNPVPKKIDALSRTRAVYAGGDYSCAVSSEGGVRCWGANAGGKLLGRGPEADPTCEDFRCSSPADVVGLPGPVVSLGTGEGHVCAVAEDGAVWCWGGNDQGQLGDATRGASAVPIRARLEVAAGAVVAGRFHTCALSVDDTVWCWGANWNGQLGRRDGEESSAPMQVAGLEGVIALAAGVEHNCALLGDGKVRCWGDNGYGQLGVRDESQYGAPACPGECRVTPAEVEDLKNVISISAGQSHSCAVLSDGTARCWGANHTGTLGIGTTTDHRTPFAVPKLEAVSAISGGGAHTCALAGDGRVSCWGHNFFGQLGTGSYSGPDDCCDGAGDCPCALRPEATLLADAIQLSAGGMHTCAVRSGGEVWCWGRNLEGQLGHGVGYYTRRPVNVIEFGP